jgi:ribonuclease P protein component
MKRNSFNKKERLKKRQGFQGIYKYGKRLEKEAFSIYFAPKKGEKGKIGIVVGSRTCNAAKRNRLKRLIREAFRQHKETIINSHDIIVKPRKSMICLSGKEAVACLADALKEITGTCC